MNLDDFIKIITIFPSLAIGMTFGILRSKFFASKYSEGLYKIFIGFSIFLLLISLGGMCYYWSELVNNEVEVKYFEFVILSLGVICSPILFLVTRKYLFEKNIFKTSELDPIINKFTSDADKNKIKLFGGDLNFFGNTPSEMNSNSQYIHLRSSNFKRVLILCESPKNKIQKIRYDKILSDISGAELRFYNPESADLRVRGRIIEVHGVLRLLVYVKIKSKVYQAIETDTADSYGALYNNIWNLAWDLAGSDST